MIIRAQGMHGILAICMVLSIPLCLRSQIDLIKPHTSRLFKLLALFGRSQFAAPSSSVTVRDTSAGIATAATRISYYLRYAAAIGKHQVACCPRLKCGSPSKSLCNLSLPLIAFNFMEPTPWSYARMATLESIQALGPCVINSITSIGPLNLRRTQKTPAENDGSMAKAKGRSLPAVLHPETSVCAASKFDVFDGALTSANSTI